MKAYLLQPSAVMYQTKFALQSNSQSELHGAHLTEPVHKLASAHTIEEADLLLNNVLKQTAS